MGTAILTIGGIVGLAALVYLVVRRSPMRSTENVRGPLRERDAEVGFERKLDAAWGPGERVDVTSCSELEDPQHVTCEKACLHEEVRSYAMH